MFEALSDQLRAIFRRRERPKYASMVKGYSPARFVKWLEDQAVAYFDANPKARKFKLHDMSGHRDVHGEDGGCQLRRCRRGLWVQPADDAATWHHP